MTGIFTGSYIIDTIFPNPEPEIFKKLLVASFGAIFISLDFGFFQKFIYLPRKIGLWMIGCLHIRKVK